MGSIHLTGILTRSVDRTFVQTYVQVAEDFVVIQSEPDDEVVRNFESRVYTFEGGNRKRKKRPLK